VYFRLARNANRDRHPGATATQTTRIGHQIFPKHRLTQIMIAESCMRNRDQLSAIMKATPVAAQVGFKPAGASARIGLKPAGASARIGFKPAGASARIGLKPPGASALDDLRGRRAHQPGPPQPGGAPPS
jgi:hypothetical protein